MKDYKPVLYISIAWLLTVGVAYGLGWWHGVSETARLATGAASGSFSAILWVLGIVAVVTAIAAFRVRGYLTRQRGNADTGYLSAK